MKIDIECADFDSVEDRNEFAANAEKAKVMWEFHKGKYYDHMILEGEEKNVKKFVEDYWQETYDDLYDNGYIIVMSLK